MTKVNHKRKTCAGCPSNPNCINKPHDHAGKTPRCKECSKEIGDALRMKRAALPRCIECRLFLPCRRAQKGGRKRSKRCASINQRHLKKSGMMIVQAAKKTRNVDKGDEYCNTPGCMNLRTGWQKRTLKDGDVVNRLRSRCNTCRRVFERTGEVLDRRHRQRRERYHTVVKTNPELMENNQQRAREYAQKGSESVPGSVGRTYIIQHPVVPRIQLPGTSSVRKGTRFGRAWSRRPRKTSNNRHRSARSPTSATSPTTCGQCQEADRSRLLKMVRNQNITQLQKDLGKLLMSVNQGFVHIIIYDIRSVKQAIGDALEGKENTRVYYPKGNTVDTNGLIVQFVDQLLFPEGFLRSSANPCRHFELAKAFSVVFNDETIEILNDDANDDGDENILTDTAAYRKSDDREALLLHLKKIDPKFLNSKCVKNSTIDFTQRYARSVEAKHQHTASPLPSSDRQLRPRKKLIETPAPTEELSEDKQTSVVEKRGRARAVEAKQGQISSSLPSSDRQLRPRKKVIETPAPTEELPQDKQTSVVEKKGKKGGRRPR